MLPIRPSRIQLTLDCPPGPHLGFRTQGKGEGVRCIPLPKEHCEGQGARGSDGRTLTIFLAAPLSTPLATLRAPPTPLITSLALFARSEISPESGSRSSRSRVLDFWPWCASAAPHALRAPLTIALDHSGRRRRRSPVRKLRARSAAFVRVGARDGVDAGRIPWKPVYAPCSLGSCVRRGGR